MPPATHARKTLVADFNGDALMDMFVLDHGFDSSPFPGSDPKLIIQNTAGSFTWSKLTDQTGFHHGGAAADIDNDGDIDVFVGGFEPFFFINDGSAGFTKVDDRFDGSIGKVFAAELIDVDEDGFVDLLLGAHEGHRLPVPRPWLMAWWCLPIHLRSRTCAKESRSLSSPSIPTAVLPAIEQT